MRGVRLGLGASTRTCSASIRRGGAASPACACPWGLGRCGHVAWTLGWPGVCLPPNRLCLFGRGLPASASASAAADTSRAKPVRAEGHQPPRLAQGCHVLVASPISETRNYLGTLGGKKSGIFLKVKLQGWEPGELVHLFTVRGELAPSPGAPDTRGKASAGHRRPGRGRGAASRARDERLVPPAPAARM